MLFADLILPAYAMPYFVGYFAPYLAAIALAGEFIAIYLIQRGHLSAAKTFAGFLIANTVSTIAGFFLLVAIDNPSAYTHYAASAVLGYFLAWALSIAIEYAVLRLLSRWLPFRRLFFTMLVGNTVSYLLLGLGHLALWMF